MRNKRLKANLITGLKITALLLTIVAIPSYCLWKEHKSFKRYQDCININIHTKNPYIANNYCLQKIKDKEMKRVVNRAIKEL